MSEADPMNVNERRKYLHKMWGRYRKADKNEKTRLLDEIEAVTGLHRKSIIRTINGQLSRKKRSRERGREYGVEVDDAIRVIARSLDYPCAERLQPNLVWMAAHLHAHGELLVRSETVEKLGRVSISTVKRILKRVGRSEPKIASQKPKRPSSPSLRKPYPMSRIDWDITEAGHLEVDLVHHCGGSVNGEYIHGLQAVDVASGWCGIVPIFGRSFRALADGFDYLLARLPFTVIEIHPDNGGEFFNQFLLRYFHTKLPDLYLSRSRPYQKNDNRFVEENNHSLLRAYLGHGRFDTLEHLHILRPLYEKLWLYHNLFQPVMRLQSKEYVSQLQYRRKFNPAKPPLDRLIELKCLDDTKRSQLQELRNTTNPMALRDQINNLISQLVYLPTLEDSHSVNVFDTLIKEVDFTLR